MKIFCLSILVILLLTGCAGPVHQVAMEYDGPFIAGELVHDRGESNHLVLEILNRRYEARSFIVERQTDLAVLRKRYYFANPKHWERIFAGLDTDHMVYSIETIAKSAEGLDISCRLMWPSVAKPSGVCTDHAGAAFSVRFN